MRRRPPRPVSAAAVKAPPSNAGRSTSRLRACVRNIVVLLFLAALISAVYGYSEALRDPIVRSARFAYLSSTSRARYVRILLIADTHVQGPDMPPSRLLRIVQQANSLHPDIVVLAGDFTGNDITATKSYSIGQGVAPLGRLHAAVGVFAVLGNNDRPRAAAVTTALEAVGVTVLDGEAVQLGPIALGGFRTRYGTSIRRLLALSGTRVLVSHSPDGFQDLPPGIDLMLAGHTHCGQIVLPVIGALSTGSEFGSRFRCGLILRRGKALVVTAGLGTSQIPIRIGAPPDMWLVQLQPRVWAR